MRILRWFKLSLLAALATASTLAIASCGSSEEEVGGFSGFLKGAAPTVTVGEEFNPKDFVYFVNDSDYTITLTGPNGFSEDVTRSRGEQTYNWALGDYKITYVINGGENEGTYEYNFKIAAPRLQVFMTLGDEDMVMTLNKPLVFADYFEGLNLDVRSYRNEYTVSMQSVTIGNLELDQEDNRPVVNLTGQTSYTPTQAAPHYFIMKVDSLDGQSYTTILPVRVAVIGDQVEANLQTPEYKNVTYYAYNAINNDMGVTFRPGFTRASNARNDIGYVGFNGDYGKGTYVKIDFTGNNMPKVAFFAPSFVNGLTGGDRGILLHNGTVRTATDPGQADCNQFGVYGPYKLKNASYNGSMDCLWSDTTAPITWNKLKTQQDRKFTYIVGIKDCADSTQVAAGQKPYVVIEALVLDRETESVIYEKTIRLENTAFTAGYFSGKVQAYGSFGVSTTFDKVYPIATGIESIDEMYESGPKFAGTASKTQAIEAEIKVMDYIGENLGEDEVFGYINVNDETDALYTFDGNGNKRINTSHPGFVQVTTETFVINAVGQYKFLWQVPTEKLPGRMLVTVSDPTLSDFEDGQNAVIKSFGTYNSDGKDGQIAVVENVGKAGNSALQGTASSFTAGMNVNFDPEWLNLVFGTGVADYFTFDVLCDQPYLRFVREGGAYMDYNYIDSETGELDPKWVYNNNYFVSNANDIGFGEHTEKIEYNGQTLYRYSILYTKVAWERISQNGTKEAKDMLSTVAFFFNSEVNTTSDYKNNRGQEAFEVAQAYVSVFYIDNVHTGRFNGKDITFANGDINGNLEVTKTGTTGGSVSVVSHGDDYALKLVTMTDTNLSNTSAFGLYSEYLHEVFNVKGANALSFKAYFDPEKVDVDKATFRFLISGKDSSGKNSYNNSATFQKDAFDATDNSITYTITKELYSKYFDENGEYKADSMTNVHTFGFLNIGMSLTKNGGTAGKGTVVYFDDFKSVMGKVIQATVSLSDEMATQYQGSTISLADLMNELTIDVTSHSTYTAALTAVSVDGVVVNLEDATEFKFEKSGLHTFILTISTSDGSTRELGVSVNINYRSVHEGVLYVDSEVSGTYDIALSSLVSNVQINGKDVDAADVTISDTGIAVSKALLAEYVGNCQITFALASGEINAANLLVYPQWINFEDGQNYVVSSFGLYSKDGIGGNVAVVDNVFKTGNMAVEGTFAGSYTNIMNMNFDSYFLDNIFNKGGADYFTFDLITDVPYIRFVREGGGYWTGEKRAYSNTYLMSDANDTGFGEPTDKVEVDGVTLYRYSLVYPKAAWLAISNNGTAAPADVLSTLACDFTGSIDLTTDPGSDKFVQNSQNCSKLYIDNVRIGQIGATNIDFADGVQSGNLRVASANGSNSVVAYGTDYAFKYVAKNRTGGARVHEPIGFQLEYLHDVFNVMGASALTFKVCVDTETVDTITAFFVSKNTSAAFTVSELDAQNSCFTVTITKAAYNTYFDATGAYIASSIEGVESISGSIGLGLTLYKGTNPAGFGTAIYLDDFTIVKA